MPTQTEELARLRLAGYVADLWLDEDGRIASSSRAWGVDEVAADELVRFEGMSNPDDEALMMAVTIEQGDGDPVRGVLSFPYGPDASGPQADTIRRLSLRAS